MDTFLLTAEPVHVYFVLFTLFFPHAVPDSVFPRLEIAGCPVTYDLQSEKYEVKFQWRAPFLPSVLSHIDFFLIRVFEYLREDIILATHANPSKVYVNVSFFSISFLVQLFTMYNSFQAFNNSLFNFTTLLDPFEDINRYYRMDVRMPVCIIIFK